MRLLTLTLVLALVLAVCLDVDGTCAVARSTDVKARRSHGPSRACDSGCHCARSRRQRRLQLARLYLVLERQRYLLRLVRLEFGVLELGRYRVRYTCLPLCALSFSISRDIDLDLDLTLAIVIASNGTSCSGGVCSQSQCYCTTPWDDFWPYSARISGQLVLMLFYGALLATGAKYIADGSEMLMEVLDPGLIGGLLLPILGAFPDAMMIIVSGAFGTTEEAQKQIVRSDPMPSNDIVSDI